MALGDIRGYIIRGRQLISTGGCLEIFLQEIKPLNYCRLAVFAGYKNISTMKSRPTLSNDILLVVFIFNLLF